MDEIFKKPHNDYLASRDEVDQHFGLSKRYLEDLARRGEGPPTVKIGRMVRYQVSDLRAWIEAHKVGASSQDPQARRQ